MDRVVRIDVHPDGRFRYADRAWGQPHGPWVNIIEGTWERKDPAVSRHTWLLTPDDPRHAPRGEATPEIRWSGGGRIVHGDGVAVVPISMWYIPVRGEDGRLDVVYSYFDGRTPPATAER